MSIELSGTVPEPSFFRTIRAPGRSRIAVACVPGTYTTAVAVSPSGAVIWYDTSRGCAASLMVSDWPCTVTPAGTQLIFRSPGVPTGSSSFLSTLTVTVAAPAGGCGAVALLAIGGIFAPVTGYTMTWASDGVEPSVSP